MKKDSIGIENRKSRVEEIDIKGKKIGNKETWSRKTLYSNRWLSASDKH